MGVCCCCCWLFSMTNVFEVKGLFVALSIALSSIFFFGFKEKETSSSHNFETDPRLSQYYQQDLNSVPTASSLFLLNKQ